MQFEDREVGKYRIHAGSLEPRAGQGHLASVIVNQSRHGKLGVREIYRNLEVSGGHRWLTSYEALQHALVLGASAVKAEQRRTMEPGGSTGMADPGSVYECSAASMHPKREQPVRNHPVNATTPTWAER